MAQAAVVWHLENAVVLVDVCEGLADRRGPGALAQLQQGDHRRAFRGRAGVATRILLAPIGTSSRRDRRPARSGAVGGAPRMPGRMTGWPRQARTAPDVERASPWNIAGRGHQVPRRRRSRLT